MFQQFSSNFIIFSSNASSYAPYDYSSVHDIVTYSQFEDPLAMNDNDYLGLNNVDDLCAPFDTSFPRPSPDTALI